MAEQINNLSSAEKKSIYDIKLKDLPLIKRGKYGVIENHWYVECDVCKKYVVLGENPDKELPEGWVHEPLGFYYFRAVCFDCAVPTLKEPEE